MPKTKLKDISDPANWPCSKYAVTVDGRCVGVVGQKKITQVVSRTNSATLSQKLEWYSVALDGKQRSHGFKRKDAVKFLEEQQ